MWSFVCIARIKLFWEICGFVVPRTEVATETGSGSRPSNQSREQHALTNKTKTKSKKKQNSKMCFYPCTRFPLAPRSAVITDCGEIDRWLSVRHSSFHVWLVVLHTPRKTMQIHNCQYMIDCVCLCSPQHFCPCWAHCCHLVTGGSTTGQ